jgi:hypothetical protein
VPLCDRLACFSASYSIQGVGKRALYNDKVVQSSFCFPYFSDILLDVTKLAQNVPHFLIGIPYN